MGAEESQKRLKKKASKRLRKPTEVRKKKKIDKKKEQHIETDISELVQNEENIHTKKEEKKNKSSRPKRRKVNSKSKVDFEKVDQITIKDKSVRGKEKYKLLISKKRKVQKVAEVESNEVDNTYDHVEDASDEHYGASETREKKRINPKKKKRKDVINKFKVGKVDKPHNAVEEGFDHLYDDGEIATVQSEALVKNENSESPEDVDTRRKVKTGKTKKPHKTNKKDCSSSKKHENISEKREEVEQGDAYQISSGDEDCTRGMKRWIMEYHQRRPGLKILQQRIDDFITIHEAKEEQARKEREAQAAEGGWTVVVHHKGRKKTTDSESGIAVGSVAPAAVMDKMAKRKNKEVLLDFYRFQKREAQRNEIMMLQSKFEEDKKRIQQLRAARKFRPY